MSATEAPPKPTHPFRYAFGMFGTSIPITLMNANLMFFYVDRHGLDGRIYGVIMAIYTVIDLFDNPFYGWLSDRTRTRWGRRRPWLIGGAPVLVLSFVMVFYPPFQHTGAGLITWLVIWAVLAQTFDSLVNASYGAVLPEAFPDERQRAVANSLRQGCQLVALIISLGVAPLLFSIMGYGQTALVLGLIALAAMLYMGFGVREDMTKLPERQPPIFESIKVIIGNKRFWIIAAASCLYSTGMALVLAAVAFFVKYELREPDTARTPLLISVILTSIAFLALWTFLVRRFGALPIWRLALATLAVALITMALAKSLIVAIVIGAFIGLGYSGVMATIDLIIARLMDEDTAATGQHRESMFIAAFGFFNHFTGVIQSIALWLAAALYGYRSGTDPGPTPGAAGVFMLSIMPATCLAIAFVCSLFVRLKPQTHPPASPEISPVSPV